MAMQKASKEKVEKTKAKAKSTTKAASKATPKKVQAKPSEKKVEAKKLTTAGILIPAIIAIATLIILTVGATYAYFTVQAENHYETTTISATAGEVGTVSLSSGSSLTMALTAEDMMKKGNDVGYYATASGKTTTATSPVIATAVVEGVGVFNCEYTLLITPTYTTSSMYSKFKAITPAANQTTGQVVLTVGSTVYDFATHDFSTAWTHTGSFTGISSSSSASTKELTAQFKILNSNTIDQSNLSGSDIRFTFTATAFSCNVVG